MMKFVCNMGLSHRVKVVIVSCCKSDKCKKQQTSTEPGPATFIAQFIL